MSLRTIKKRGHAPFSTAISVYLITFISNHNQFQTLSCLFREPSSCIQMSLPLYHNHTKGCRKYGQHKQSHVKSIHRVIPCFGDIYRIIPCLCSAFLLKISHKMGAVRDINRDGLILFINCTIVQPDLFICLCRICLFCCLFGICIFCCLFGICAFCRFFRLCAFCRFFRLCAFCRFFRLCILCRS